MKNTQINLRLSSEDLELIRQVSTKYDMTVSAFIMSVIKPLCLKKISEAEPNENK